MSFSIHELVVPSFTHGLKVMGKYLDYAQEIDRVRPGQSVLEFRLVPDMLSLGDQFRVTTNKVERHLANLAGREPPAPQKVALEYAALKRRIGEALDFVQSFSPEQLADAETHPYHLASPIMQGYLRAEDYVRHVIIPDFYFHIAIAHGMLRHLDAPLGKRDYLGDIAFESGGYT